jgi:ribosome-binding factor A
MAQESVRQRKVADKIKEVVSLIIDRELKDPNKGFVTVTNVKISPDLRIASIYFTTLGGENKRKKSLAALNRAKNFIRTSMAPHLNMRVLPDIRFFFDDTLDYAMKIEDLIKKAKEADEKLKGDESDD